MSNPHWLYIPGFLNDGEKIFTDLLPQLLDKGEVRQRFLYGKVVNVPRQSCVMIINPIPNNNKVFEKEYGDHPKYYGEDIPIQIRAMIKLFTDQFNLKFDYVLCHVYRNGHDYVSYHSDGEALNSDVASLSLSKNGVERKFRLRPLGQKPGFQDEIMLQTGDLVYMYGPNEKNNYTGCQQVYEHSLIKIGGKKGEQTGPRINLTFRFYE